MTRSDVSDACDASDASDASDALFFSFQVTEMKLLSTAVTLLLIFSLVMVVLSEDCSKQLESYTSNVCREDNDGDDCRRCVEDQSKASGCKADKDCQKAIFCLEAELIQKNCIKS